MLSKLWTGFIFLIIIGMVGLGINTLFGYQTVTFIYRVRINEVWIWKYDIWAYIQEIKNALTDTSRLQLTWQNRQWMNFDANIFDGEFWEGLINNMAYMLNVIIFGLNVLLYPIRIGAYALQVLGSIIGLPVISYEPENALAWLFDTTSFFATFQIPYV